MLAARETRMLSAERMERMIDAPTNDEAAKTLEECGYGDLSGLSAKEVNAALVARIAAVFTELENMVPERELVQLFRLKYDYHNAKTLMKAQAAGVDGSALLSQRGNVPVAVMKNAFVNEDYSDVPPMLAEAMQEAAGILSRTANPQLADFAMDRAYFAQLLSLGKRSTTAASRSATSACRSTAPISAPRCARTAWGRTTTSSRRRSSPAARSARTALRRRPIPPRRSRGCTT